MVCSICKGAGHNRTTCQSSSSHRPPPARNVGGTRNKAKMNLDINPMSLEEKEEKLKYFKTRRKEQYKIANDCVESLMDGKNISITAEEKSGKREIMECIHLILNINHSMNLGGSVKSIYLTALDRKDTKVQFEEQESFGITSLVGTYSKANELLGEIVKIMTDPTSSDSMIYIHLDECDYGTGSTQSLSSLYNSNELETHRERVKFITYSATPQELLMAVQIEAPDWAFHTFVPHESYFGAQKYIDNELVFKPKKFFDKGTLTITEHGSEIIQEMRSNLEDYPSNRRNIIVVRDTTSGNLELIKENKEDIESDHNCELRIYDKDESFEWGNPEKWAELGTVREYNGYLEPTGTSYKPVVIFIAQICKRSTEICPLGHLRLYAWHDARLLSDNKPFNTLSQAIGRVKHYTQSGYPENSIKLYCDIDILNYTVGKELENTEKKYLNVSQRVGKTVHKEKRFIFDGFEDKYTMPSDVPDSEWIIGSPPKSRTNYHMVDGKWCHYDKRVRYFSNDYDGGRGGFSFAHRENRGGKETILQYENPESDRFIIRTALTKENPDNTGEDKVDFATNEKSMYT